MPIFKMNSLAIASLTLLACGPLAVFSPSSNVTEPKPTTLSTPVHCQVPCGIYGDRMRIDMLMEDAATIEKAMQKLHEMDAEEAPSKNQLVRWVVTKEEHAQKIQDQVASYWLAQRIKAPAGDAGEAALAKYHNQLVALHGVTVAAMKCKQTTDLEHVKKLRGLALTLSELYFSEEDLEHVKSHHAGH